MDLDTLVMTAYSLHDVKATRAETYAGPIPGTQQSVIWFATAEESTRFATGCMAEGLPARSYGLTVLVLH